MKIEIGPSIQAILGKNVDAVGASSLMKAMDVIGVGMEYKRER